MSTRAYDFVIAVANASSFRTGNIVYGLSSSAVGEVVSVDEASNSLKVRTSNVFLEFLDGEYLVSNTAIVYTQNAFIDHSDSVDGLTDTFITPTTVDLTDSVLVYVDGVPAPKESYIVKDSNTIQFLPIDRLVDPNTNERELSIYPDDAVSSLLVQVVRANTEAHSFVAANLINYVETANSAITSITSAPYISEKNSYEQTPLVKLYTLYYPGEWYPPNSSGNPTKTGAGYPWPYPFPLRYAEVVGETFSDFNYAVSFGGESYEVTAIDSGDISTDSTGRISEIQLTLSNFDGYIASILDNPYLVGNNTTNSAVAFVNGEIVTNIDPRTVSSNEFYDADVAATRGENAAWDYSSATANGDTWTLLKSDSRDLLDGILEIKLTYAKFLDYWPEYSLVTGSTDNSAIMYSTGPYRVGDIVTSNTNPQTSEIQDIRGNTVFFSNTALAFLSINSKLLIVNAEADSKASVDHVFVVNKLDNIDELSATLSLTNWLQYVKFKLPKRKFYAATCPFAYKGSKCKYPSSGTGTIVNSNPPLTANGFFDVNNVPTLNASEDVCAKTKEACALRRNLINFGGFPGVTE